MAASQRGGLAPKRDHTNYTLYEKWEVLLGIRLLGTAFWCGLSNHRAATAQMGT